MLTNNSNPQPSNPVAALENALSNNGGVPSATHHMEDLSKLPDPLPNIQQQPVVAETTAPVVEQQPVAQPQQVQPEVPEVAPIPPEIAQKYGDLDVYLEHRLGAPLDQIVEVLNNLNQFRNESVAEQQVRQLRESWSVPTDEFDRRMGLIKEEFAKLPPHMQAAMDNVEGAQLLWSRIALKQQSVSVPGAPPRITTNTRQLGGLSSAQYDYTQRQIIELAASNPAEYDAQASRIAQAYAAGRVYMDV